MMKEQSSRCDNVFQIYYGKSIFIPPLLGHSRTTAWRSFEHLLLLIRLKKKMDYQIQICSVIRSAGPRAPGRSCANFRRVLGLQVRTRTYSKLLSRWQYLTSGLAASAVILLEEWNWRCIGSCTHCLSEEVQGWPRCLDRQMLRIQLALDPALLVTGLQNPSSPKGYWCPYHCLAISQHALALASSLPLSWPVVFVVR